MLGLVSEDLYLSPDWATAGSMTLVKSSDHTPAPGLNFLIYKMKILFVPLIGSLRGSNERADQKTGLRIEKCFRK